MRNNKKTLLFLFILLTIIFCYFRLKPIYFQTIPYTFDQGRDFLKAQEIIRDKNLMFIGPTTGVQGIFHGAWWYYFLAIPYVLFSGNPLGFVLFIFLSAFIQYFLFYLFIKKEFDSKSSLLFASLIAGSSYFIGTSYFAINSIMTFPFILLFFFSLYKFLGKKENKYLLLIFLSLGFIFEFEVAFGIFIIPSFLISILILRKFKDFFPNFKSSLYAFIGLLIPIVPRIMFEIKNNFPELKIILAFIINPKIYDSKTLTERIYDRFLLFYNYYASLFPDKNIFLALIAILILIVGLIMGYRKFSKIKKNFLKITLSTFGLLFILSLFYKDNFWSNYYEGLPYFYALFLSIGAYGFQKNKFKQKYFNFIPIFFISIIIIVSLFNLIKDIKTIKPEEITGMRVQTTVVSKLYKHVGSKDLCVRIYTPPVIPYTYTYLFDYFSRKNGLKYPFDNFKEGKCYFIMEKEQEGYNFEQRIVKWRLENIPKNTVLVKKEFVGDNVVIELWQEKQ
ncbi:MAG: glycosyltransferase family 39 protein [bacterium]